MKEKIINNLYLRVDFETVKSAGGFIAKKKVYLIGTLPVLLCYKDNIKEFSKINVREEILLNDRQLSKMLGIKATDADKIGKYRPQIKEMVAKLEAVITKALLAKDWLGMAIEDIRIVKMA